ncbi:adenylosuccinate lyase [Streptomyces sp. NPDC047130]|uniref:HEAT repeat domain-containing protein n=1 Tax=Streptomyces sp. NPDC047130 TaxID=3155261 RepID=UPI0033FDAE37
MDDEGQLAALEARLRAESGGGFAHRRLVSDAEPAELAELLGEPGHPLWARELAAFRLGLAGDGRAFEPLVLLLNHRDAPRCASAAYALARLGDPRTGRAAAALATNELRVGYALHPVRLLVALRAPEAVPALVTVLERRLAADRDPHREVALACVEGLGALGDPRARDVLGRARDSGRPELAAAARAALRALQAEGGEEAADAAGAGAGGPAEGAGRT